MPFREHVSASSSRTHSAARRRVYFQIDYTLEPALADERGATCTSSFRRENPTTLTARLRDRRRPPRARPVPRLRRRRAADRRGHVVRRGRGEGLPRRRHASCRRSAAPASRTTSAARGAWARTPAPYAGAPLDVARDAGRVPRLAIPDFVGFYRWHLPDPIVFRDELRVTIQQIGAVVLRGRRRTPKPTRTSRRIRPPARGMARRRRARRRDVRRSASGSTTTARPRSCTAADAQAGAAGRRGRRRAPTSSADPTKRATPVMEFMSSAWARYRARAATEWIWR